MSARWRCGTARTSFIPSLLQDEAYARAVIRGVVPGATDSEVEDRARARIERGRLHPSGLARMPLTNTRRAGVESIASAAGDLLADMVGGQAHGCAPGHLIQRVGCRA
ncbi:MAG: DUF5753 domain-containing protein [Actinomycetota bacterium]|nr:DUF5753 domain-containing protein [Actinomycetota bacterium]